MAAGADASEQIALQIRHYLEQKGLRPGDRIGTETELAAEFGVSRPTLREALRLLASSHLIRVDRGAGGRPPSACAVHLQPVAQAAPRPPAPPTPSARPRPAP